MKFRNVRFEVRAVIYCELRSSVAWSLIAFAGSGVVCVILESRITCQNYVIVRYVGIGYQLILIVGFCCVGTYHGRTTTHPLLIPPIPSTHLPTYIDTHTLVNPTPIHPTPNPPAHPPHTTTSPKQYNGDI